MTHTLLTVDVEDWFQVENFKDRIPFSTWDSQELRVEQNVHRLLDLFDDPPRPSAGCRLFSRYWVDSNSRGSLKSNEPGIVNRQDRIRATFFILGWIAERLPGLVREIVSRGHEIASHGYNHDLPNGLDAPALKRDLVESKDYLEQSLGIEVAGYRASSFAVSPHVLHAVRAAHGRVAACSSVRWSGT